MLSASYTSYSLKFKIPGGTSRGVLKEKETFFIRIVDDENPEIIGIGECALFRGLSMDDVPEYENVLADVCWNIDDYKKDYLQRLKMFPSIVCGLEMAFADLRNKGIRQPFPSSFTTDGDFIRINGLIWMGAKKEMKKRIIEKIENGFSCIKIKIGAIDFDEELELLKYIRTEFKNDNLELRVDANGAFSTGEIGEKLNRLEPLKIHSIEQPIKKGMWEEMAEVCRFSPIPVALDEELIGITEEAQRIDLLQEIKPHYLVLKPGLHGGFHGCEKWIRLTEKTNTGWWLTSALESSIGLNAIAQWTYLQIQHNPMAQGLGTGQLFTNDVFPLTRLEGEKLFFNTEWDKNIFD